MQWTYCGQTIVYSYEKDGKEDNYVAFFETKLEETYKKYVGHLIGIGSYDEHCVIVSKTDQSITVRFLRDKILQIVELLLFGYHFDYYKWCIKRSIFAN